MSEEEIISASDMREEQTEKDFHPLLDALEIRTGYSNNVLIRMLIVSIVVAGVILWNLDLIKSIYFAHQINIIGPLINSAILVLFGLGVIKLIVTYFRYAGEEAAIARFLRNERSNAMDPLQRVATGSIIARRYRLMEGLYDQRVVINHSAVASMLLAGESTRLSLARFINNILILTGVFGTIVSLSMALLGASNLLEGVGGSTNGMSQVLNGMSTALSTTITAIVCYLFFGYFYLKLTDVQTNVVNAIEQTTAALLIPKFNVQSDTVMQDVASLARKLQKLVDKLEEAQARYSASGQKLFDAVSSYGIRGQTISNDISIIKELLRNGFRLYEEDED